MADKPAPQKTTEQRRAERLIKDISHIKPETVQALAQAGYQSLQDLLKASSERIAQESKIAIEKAKELRAEAEKLAQHIAEGAKTAEGRKQLVTEGKDFAQKTAKSIEAQARDLLQKVQADGESAIEMAKKVRDQAPEKLQEYRKKAEAALKDAEAKVKDLQSKAPDAVKDAQKKAQDALKDAQAKVEELAKKTEEFAKHELEKVKAANEGTIKRVRSKFEKKN